MEESNRAEAVLALCPEFLATGYLYHHSIWDSAEPRGGPTETWLGKMARSHGMLIGASYLEADGEDLFNTFTLVNPDGSVAGRVRKHTPGFIEARYFKSGTESRVIQTEVGRVGVGICFDNYTQDFLEEMHREKVDLILMPHSSPVPKTSRFIARAVSFGVHNIASYCARALETPVLMVNKASHGCFNTPLPPIPFLRIPMFFRGSSTICDADGTVIARVGESEGVVIADVTLDPERKTIRLPQTRDYWSLEPDRFPRLLAGCHKISKTVGGLSYSLSRRRRRAASSVSSRSADVVSIEPASAID